MHQSHPPNPELSEQLFARLGRVEDFDEPRTMHRERRVSARLGWAGEKGDFFSILSEKLPQDIAKRCQSWYNSDPVAICSPMWARSTVNKVSVI